MIGTVYQCLFQLSPVNRKDFFAAKLRTPAKATFHPLNHLEIAALARPANNLTIAICKNVGCKAKGQNARCCKDRIANINATKFKKADMKTLFENKCFGGVQGVYSHASKPCNCHMVRADRQIWAAEHGVAGDADYALGQSTNDQFLANLKPEALPAAKATRLQNGVFRMQDGYDHSCFFVSTFMEDHIAFHAGALFGPT